MPFSILKSGGDDVANDEIKELHEILTALRIEVGKITEKLDTLKQVSSKVDTVEKNAIEALSSVKSAHHRIERIEKTIYWLATTVIGALLTGIIVFIVKGGFTS